jgi:hypothetical protein
MVIVSAAPGTPAGHHLPGGTAVTIARPGIRRFTEIIRCFV